MNGKPLFIALLFATNLCVAQISPIDQALEYLVEFGQTEGAQPDLVQVAEQLSYLQNNPISLNTATAEELLEIPLLNSFLVFNFISYRNSSGRVLSYYQLADIKGFSPQLIQLLKPFTTLLKKSESASWPRHFSHQLAVQYKQVLQKSQGYKNGNYQGDASALYLRYRMQADGKLFAGFTAQKDAGEVWLQNGLPDYSSFHVEYRLNKTVKNIVLGDFSAEFGQGLVLWSSLAFNKSSEAVTIQRFGKGLRHYTGADENRFLRGAGTTLSLGQFEIAAFHSGNKVDANLAIDENNAIVATSLQSSGFHRTENEKVDQNSMLVNMTGIYTQWKPKRIRLGLNLLRTHFSYPIQFQDRIENVNRFSGDELVHSALDWKFLYGRLFLFGETAYEFKTNSAAITSGIQVQAADGLQWVAQYRYLAPRWFAPYGQPFSETGREGEQGFYIGFNWQLPKNISLAFYADHFQYLWLRTNLNKPGNGRDYMAQINLTNPFFNTYFRLRFLGRLQNLSSTNTIESAFPEERFSIRWHSTFQATEKISLNCRIEWANVSQEQAAESGLLAFVGTNIRLKEKWNLKLRYTVFDTKSYTSAIWAYEDDLPYSFSVPAFYDSGNKWYAILVWSAKSNLDFWFKISDLTYANLATIGSGYDLITSSKRTEIKLLAQISF